MLLSIINICRITEIIFNYYKHLYICYAICILQGQGVKGENSKHSGTLSPEFSPLKSQSNPLNKHKNTIFPSKFWM